VCSPLPSLSLNHTHFLSLSLSLFLSLYRSQDLSGWDRLRMSVAAEKVRRASHRQQKLGNPGDGRADLLTYLADTKGDTPWGHDAATGGKIHPCLPTYDMHASSSSFDRHVSSSSYDMHVSSAPHMTCMYPPLHMTVDFTHELYPRVPESPRSGVSRTPSVASR
jgi:hypothetical protein